MATVQAYTKSGVDAKFNSRSNMTMVHNGGGSPDISAYPDSKTGDVIERSSDGARWGVVASTVSPIAGRVVSVAGKTGVVTLGPGDIGAAPASHTHTTSQISNLPNVTTAVNNGTVVQRTTVGQVYVPLAPSERQSATSKDYVDSQINWVNLSGKPSTFPPSTHSHTQAQVTGLPAKLTAYDTAVDRVNSRITSISGTTTDAGKLLALTSTGRLGSVNPINAVDVANKRYVDDQISAKTTWANTSGKPTTFTPSAHTHHTSDISNLPGVSALPTSDTLAKRDSHGRINVAEPVTDTQATTKRYVDNQISTHTHTMANITNLPSVTTTVDKSTIVQRTSLGQVAVPTNPSEPQHATSRAYVESKFVSTLLSTENLNDVIDPGTYLQGTADNATTSRNYPSDRAGGHLVVTRHGNYVKQEYTHVHGTYVCYRTKYSNTWTPWKYVIDKILSSSITTEDLNNVTTPGNYVQGFNGNATPARNYPPGATAGHLVVLQGDLLTKQEYTDHKGISMHYRTKYADTWYPWQSITQTAV